MINYSNEQIISWVIEGVLQVFYILFPYIIQVFVVVWLFGVAKRIIYSFTHKSSRFLGYNRCKSKRQAKKVGEMYNNISATKDINDALKK